MGELLPFWRGLMGTWSKRVQLMGRRVRGDNQGQGLCDGQDQGDGVGGLFLGDTIVDGLSHNIPAIGGRVGN